MYPIQMPQNTETEIMTQYDDAKLFTLLQKYTQ